MHISQWVSDVTRIRSRLRPAPEVSSRPAPSLDRAAIVGDRLRGQSLGQIAKAYRISRTTVHRVIHEQNPAEKVA